MPAHFNQANHTLEDLKVAVLKAGLGNQEYREKQEMRLIFKYGTVSPSGVNQDRVVGKPINSNLRLKVNRGSIMILKVHFKLMLKKSLRQN